MKKILLVLVGGTICTYLNKKGTLSVSENAGLFLTENFKNSDSIFRDKVEFDITENLFILSENMTVNKWNVMIDTLREHINKDNYAGIIFAHGTDTLAYSASLFSLILANTDIPVFFVSSNKRITLKNANGNDNFKYAVDCILRGIKPNVYVTYKNISDSKMYLHLASRIKQCENYSEDFYSKDAIDITDITEENYVDYFGKIEEKYPQKDKKCVVDINGNWHLSNCVLFIKPYVGINYDAFDYNRFSAVLHGTYHSGTACVEKTQKCEEYSENSILYMIDRCLTNKTDVYISPSKPEGEVYDTVRIINEHTVNNRKIKFLHGCTDEMAYVKLVLAYSVFKDEKERKDFLKTQCNFEFIDE